MNLRSIRRGALLAAVLLGVGGTSMAVATDGSASVPRYCAAMATSTGTPAHLHCFSNFASSIAYATSGKVQLANAAHSRSVSTAELRGETAAGVVPNTTYVLSIDYHDSGYQGSTFTWYQTSRCGYFQTSSMPSGWNDQVSSVQNYSGCATTLFWNSGFGKPTYPIGVDKGASSLGSFNDQTSSQKWCPSYPCA